jgi:hypothetical protein
MREGEEGKGEKVRRTTNLFNHRRHLRHREKQNLLFYGFLLKVLFLKVFSVSLWLMVFLISSHGLA